MSARASSAANETQWHKHFPLMSCITIYAGGTPASFGAGIAGILPSSAAAQLNVESGHQDAVGARPCL